METPAKPSLLYLLHSGSAAGGVEAHCRALAEELQDAFSVSIAYPETTGSIIVADRSAPPQRFAVDGGKPKQALASFFRQLSPDIVHVQHPLHWPEELLEVVAALDCVRICSLHDFWSLSPHFTLYGSPPELAAIDAAMYLDGRSAVTRRCKEMQRTLSRFDACLAPSLYLRNELSEALQLPISVLEPGVSLPVSASTPPRKDALLRFGYLSTLVTHKGWQIAVEAQREIFSSAHSSMLLVAGQSSGAVPENSSGIRYLGSYTKTELPSLLARVDVGLIPSVFRESYSLLLSEFFAAGIPVIASDIGALRERVRPYENGLLVKVGCPASLQSAMRWFLDSREWRTWKIAKPRSRQEMAAEALALYQGLRKPAR